MWVANAAALPCGDCGYESHHFRSIMTVTQTEVSGCTFWDCPSFPGSEVTLIRDLPCCPGVEAVPMEVPGQACSYPQ